eukprot:10630775-Alexandrium_andersonii.AAC.1
MAKDERERVRKEAVDFEIVDGLLTRVVKRPGEDVAMSVAVPAGGVRGMTINGKRYTLGWRSWILWHLHNNTAGGH